MNSIYTKLLSIELGEVSLWDALEFTNKYAKTDSEFREFIISIANRSDRNGMSIAEFIKLVKGARG